MYGNGGIARFLMKLIQESDDYNWTVFSVEKRKEYLAALDKSVVNQEIDFAKFNYELIAK